jgi:hypothetical protein
MCFEIMKQAGDEDRAAELMVTWRLELTATQDEGPLLAREFSLARIAGPLIGQAR